VHDHSGDDPQGRSSGGSCCGILRAYAALEAKTRKSVRIAMRSSAVGEDTEASFAGQYRTELNVTGETVLDAYKAVVASKYSPRAILYRLRYGLDDSDTPCALRYRHGGFPGERRALHGGSCDPDVGIGQDQRIWVSVNTW